MVQDMFGDIDENSDQVVNWDEFWSFWRGFFFFNFEDTVNQNQNPNAKEELADMLDKMIESKKK
jgi:hypothetical protein